MHFASNKHWQPALKVFTVLKLHQHVHQCKIVFRTYIQNVQQKTIVYNIVLYTILLLV